MNQIRGKIFVEENKVYANVSSEIFDFYKNLVYKEYPNLKFGLASPRHGHHVTIARHPIHNFDYEKALQFRGEEVDIKFGPEDIYIGGFNKGFIGFYTYVYSSRLEEIRDILGVCGGNDSLHITMFSTKSERNNNAIKNKNSSKQLL